MHFLGQEALEQEEEVVMAGIVVSYEARRLNSLCLSLAPWPGGGPYVNSPDSRHLHPRH